MDSTKRNIITITSDSIGGSLYTLINKRGSKLSISSLGATIMSIIVPDSNGNFDEIVVSDINTPSLSAFAGIMCHSKIEETNSVTFFPPSVDECDVDTAPQVTYVWNDDDSLEVHTNIGAEKTTFSLCLNLDGVGQPMHNDTLYINSSEYLPKDAHQPISVKSTPYDYTHAQKLGDAPVTCDGGCWLIDDFTSGVVNDALVLASHTTGRQLCLYTSDPCIDVSLSHDSDRSEMGLLIKSFYNFVPKDVAADEQQLVILEFSNM